MSARRFNYQLYKHSEEESVVMASDYDKLAKAARNLIDEADLNCMRASEEISVTEGCPCPVCVLQRLATQGNPEGNAK